MLVAMDIAQGSAAAASASGAPWIVAGVLVAVAVLLLAGLVVALIRGRTAVRAEPSEVGTVDDLPGFLESPPGSAGSRAAPVGRVVPLAAPSPPGPPASRGRAPHRRAPVAVLGAVAGLAVVLVAAAVGMLTAPDSRADRPGRDGRPHPPAEVRMSFAGLVLEQHAVGITAAYPEVELTGGRGGPIARLTLPTWNCLSADAPDDPAAAGCVPARTEYAELRPPALEVAREGNGLLFGGRFPTSTRPTGSAPEPTGRTYGVEITVPVDGDACRGRRPVAGGVLTLDGRHAVSVEGHLRLHC